MVKLLHGLRNFARRESGVAAVEYALLASKGNGGGNGKGGPGTGGGGKGG